MEADRNAAVCESAEVVVNAPPELVWDTLTDLASWPRWMPGVTKMDGAGPLVVGTRFTWKTGRTTIRSEVLESDRPGSVGWRGRALGVPAIHVWRMQREGDGTRVFSEESFGGPLARMFRGSMRTTVRKALDDGLPALKGEAERRSRGEVGNERQS